MEENHYLPDSDRLSIVTAVVMLAYSTAAFVHLPENSLSLQLPGFLFVINITFFTIVSLLVAGLAAAGMDWIIAGHPRLGEARHWPHWILPALMAMVIGVPLNEIAVSAVWWVIFGLGGLLFAGVLIAEYISVDPGDTLYPLAVVGLTIVSMGLFLILTIAVRGAGLRLYAVAAAILPAAALVCGRTLILRIPGDRVIPWSAGITLAVSQLAFCLFYFPIRPVQFGLILMGTIYALISLAANLEESSPRAAVWAEPALMFAAFFALSFIL